MRIAPPIPLWSLAGFYTPAATWKNASLLERANTFALLLAWTTTNLSIHQLRANPHFFPDQSTLCCFLLETTPINFPERRKRVETRKRRRGTIHQNFIFVTKGSFIRETEAQRTKLQSTRSYVSWNISAKRERGHSIRSIESSFINDEQKARLSNANYFSSATRAALPFHVGEHGHDGWKIGDRCAPYSRGIET